MSKGGSINQINFNSSNFEYKKPILKERSYVRKNDKDNDKINEKINEIFLLIYEEKFNEILLKRKDIFLQEIIKELKNILLKLLSKDKENLDEYLDKLKDELEKKYYIDYNYLNSEWKKYENKPKDYNFLSRFRKHCIHTDDLAHHSCENQISKLIEIKNNKINDDILYVICTECKKCFFSKEINLYCNYCKLEYYSCTLSKDDNPNILPATWEKYHCGGIINNTMKCIKCQNIFYLNLKENYLVCLNKNCNFKAKPESIIWNCAICKKDFKSNAKIYNPLETDYIKKAINKTLFFQKKAYPTELPCCKGNINDLTFYHKEDCNGELYIGNLSDKEIIVCSKCHAMNFYDKFIWICPLCKKKFRNYKSPWGKFFKKKEYILPDLSPNIKKRYIENDDNDIGKNFFFASTNFDNFSLNGNSSLHKNNTMKNRLNFSMGNVKSLKSQTESSNNDTIKKRNRIFLIDILEERNKHQDDNIICNSDRGNLKSYSKFKHIKNSSHSEKRMMEINPLEQENNINFSTNENSSIGGTSNQPSIKIKKIKLNLNETFEKTKGISNEEEESISSNYNNEKTHKTQHTFSKKSSKNYDDCTIEEIEKEEMDTINDLNDDDAYVNINISRKPSNNMRYIRKSNDRLDILINNNKDRRKSNSSLGDLSSNSEISINFGNILTNPEKLNFIAKEGEIPEFDIDDYDYLEPIGDGSYGKIYLVKNKDDNSKYALKKIICHDLKEVKNIQKELELVYSTIHENLMKIIAIQYKCLDITTYSIYILMELGLSDWNEEIKRRAKKKNYYTEKEIIDILKQLTDALLYLEIQGIAHRDIKPQNILIFENNVFKLTDFGEAKNLSDTSQQATLRGSELYMSPMLYNGLKYNQRDVMHNPYKSDVYSLGLCFIYALSLNLNILNDLREVINMKVVKSIISRALKKNYSMKIIELISKMLELNERIRYSFEDIDKYVSENYNSV